MTSLDNGDSGHIRPWGATQVVREPEAGIMHFALLRHPLDEAKTGAPYWTWARLLGRVFDLDMGSCPFCRRGSLRIIAAITQAIPFEIVLP